MILYTSTLNPNDMKENKTMKIKEFVKTLDRDTVYYIHFNMGDWGIIFNNILFLDDGSYDILDECSYLEDEDIIYDGSSAEGFEFCTENNQVYPNNPMPELKVGMFIECDNTYGNSLGKSLGVVIDNNKTVFQNGMWASGTNSSWYNKHITKIFGDNVVCFNGCTENNVIWRRK